KAERLTQAELVLVVHSPTRELRAVLADGRVASWPAATRHAVWSDRTAVDEPETRSRQGDEQRGMPGHRLGHRLAAAEPRRDQVVGVLAVALGARGADGLATVAARFAQDPVGLGVRRPDLSSTLRVAGFDTSLQPDGPCAVAGRTQLRLEPCEVRAAGTRNEL